MRFLSAFFIVFILGITAAHAVDKEAPVDFSADELTYDRAMNLIIARGHVTFTQGKSSLKADHVNYDTTDGVVIASGNVEIYTPDGGLMEGNYARLSGDLKDGLIRKIRYTLADKSVLTAKEAQHIQGNFTEFGDVAYSSCDFCEDGSRFWEVKAQKMTHDKEAQKMTAYNAIMTVADIPVFYLPYFSYPDPTVKRKTGFLMPSFKSNRALGAGLITPFYWEVDPYMDVLLSPWIASDGVLLSGEVRRNFTEGDVRLSGSYVDDSGWNRYNIQGNANWNINEVWSSSLNIDHASDDTYLRRYDIRNEDIYAPWLKSDFEVRALTSDTYFSLMGMHYQNMRDNIDDKTIPEVFPMMTFSHVTAPSDIGGYWHFGASSSVLKRDRGADSSRLSLETGWILSGISDWGGRYDFNATALVNGYRVADHYIEAENRTFTGEISSFNPRASLKVSYPFVRVGEEYNQILEPIVMGVFAPNSKNSNKIPNEDSSDLDFDDTSLFAENRFVGYDMFEPGSRVNYGLKWSMYGQQSGYISALIGQSYRFTNSGIFPVDSGLESKASDIVGRVEIQPNEFISLSYSFRLDRSTFELNRNDVSLSVGNALLRVNASYINLKSKESQYSAYNNREELNYSLQSQLTRYWMVKFNQRINLSSGGGVLETGGYIRYEDECFALETGLKKDYTYDRDYESGVTFGLSVEFKPFGVFNL